MSGLVARGVSVVRGGRPLLTGVDVRVEPGELLVLVGPNGAGKSTLVRALSGELRPDRGEISLAGEPLTGLPPSTLAQRRAFLRQRFSVSSPLTAAEVVELGTLGRPRRNEPPGLVARLLAEVGLQGLAQRAYDALSGGEQQRVHLARVLAQLEGSEERARVLLLDEPSSSLDARHQHSTLELVRGRARRGWAVAAVVHDLALACRYGDRLLVLDRGSVAFAGPPARLGRELVERVFGIVVRDVAGAGDRPLFLVEGAAR